MPLTVHGLWGHAPTLGMLRTSRPITVGVMQKEFEQMVIGILLMLISGFALADIGDNVLMGKWKSDKEKTLAYVKSVYPDVPENNLDQIEKILGTLTVTFSENEVITEMAGLQLGKGKYSILLVTESLVVIDDASWGWSFNEDKCR